MGWGGSVVNVGPRGKNYCKVGKNYCKVVEAGRPGFR